MLRDPAGWPKEAAPLRVRARVMSNLAEQRQQAPQRVTMYRDKGWSRRGRLQFSLRPPLAAAAVVAMIVSAAVHFMGGSAAWQPWANGLANRFYDVEPNGQQFNAIANNEINRPLNDMGRSEAEALFSDVLRFRAHMTGRIPMREQADEPGPSQDTPRQAPPTRRPSDPSPASS